MTENQYSDQADAEQHPADPFQAQPNPAGASPRKSRTGLWIGLGIGGFLLLLLAAGGIAVAVWALSDDADEPTVAADDAPAADEPEDILDLLEDYDGPVSDLGYDLGGDLDLPAPAALPSGWPTRSDQSGDLSIAYSPEWFEFTDDLGEFPDASGIGFRYEAFGAWLPEGELPTYGDTVVVLGTYSSLPVFLEQFHSSFFDSAVATNNGTGERNSANYITAAGFPAIVTTEPISVYGSEGMLMVSSVAVDGGVIAFQYASFGPDHDDTLALLLGLTDSLE